MKRAIRRHQKRVASVRRVNIICEAGWRWLAEGDYLGRPYKIWQDSLLPMRENGHKWWRKEMMTRPDRAKEHHALRLCERGVDDALLYWPTHRDWWVYYW